MEREFTAVFEQDGEWWLGWSPEVRGAYAQERTLEEARESLREAIQLVLDHIRQRTEEDLAGRTTVQERILVALP